MEQTRTIGKVFSDYKTEANIRQVEIKEMNLIKKTNVLQLDLKSNTYIEVKELWFFEKFLKDRFQFSNVDMKITYIDDVSKKDIKELTFAIWIVILNTFGTWVPAV